MVISQQRPSLSASPFHPLLRSRQDLMTKHGLRCLSQGITGLSWFRVAQSTFPASSDITASKKK